MPKGIPKNGFNKGWFKKEKRPERMTGLIKICNCGKQFYCEKSKINRKKYCSIKCRCDFHPTGAKYSEEAKRKISVSKKGTKYSLEARKNMSLSHIGKKQSEITKERNKLSQIKRWDKVGRKEYRRYNHLSSSRIYKEWRTYVFKRDKWSCRLCGDNGYLQAHHILRWVDYPDLRYQINNGITLCLAHHPRKRAEEKRLEPYFKELVSVSK